MGTAFVIARREFAAYFKSPIAYIVLAAFLALTGYLFFDQFFLLKNASMDGYFGSMPFLLLFFAPAIAMRLISEERGSGTIEMLLTFPVRDWEVVAGKYLAALGMFAVGLLLSLPFAFTVASLGPLDWGPVWGGYLGTLLLGGTYLAVGMFASALTRNQIVAFILGVAICLGLFFLDSFVVLGRPLGPIFQYASPKFHFQGIARGVVELRNVVYYVSAIGIALLATAQVLESRKWV
jgi:ABC-2 type transport system permease protein